MDCKEYYTINIIILLKETDLSEVGKLQCQCRVLNLLNAHAPQFEGSKNVHRAKDESTVLLSILTSETQDSRYWLEFQCDITHPGVAIAMQEFLKISWFAGAKDCPSFVNLKQRLYSTV